MDVEDIKYRNGKKGRRKNIKKNDSLILDFVLSKNLRIILLLLCVLSIIFDVYMTYHMGYLKYGHDEFLNRESNTVLVRDLKAGSSFFASRSIITLLISPFGLFFVLAYIKNIILKGFPNLVSSIFLGVYALSLLLIIIAIFLHILGGLSWL